MILLAMTGMLIATDVSGAQDGTWTTAGNPYNVVGDITISEGLTIEAGCEVVVQGDYTIEVTGCIQCVGTETDSVIVTATNTWQGFRLNNASMQSQFAYTRIEDTAGTNAYGIYVIDSPVVIHHCRIQNHDKGISFIALGAANPNDASLSDCVITHCNQNGILVTEYTPLTINDCEITRCGLGTQYRGAIQLSVQTGGYSCNPVILNNHIHDNLKQGLILVDMYDAGTINPTVEGNLIENNLTGVYCYNTNGYFKENTIRNNFIVGDGNSGAGVMCYGAAACPVLTRNLITGNYCGFYIVNDATANIGNLANASIDDDGCNIIMHNIDPTSVHYDIYANTTAGIVAQGNYWDPDMDIAAVILDGNDGSGTGTVDFSSSHTYFPPQLADVSPITGCIGQNFEFHAPVNCPLIYLLSFTADLPGWLAMTYDENGLPIISGVPTEGGNFPFSITANDGLSDPVTHEWVVTVTGENIPPIFQTTPPSTGSVGEIYVYNMAASDPDNDMITFAIQSGPAWLQVETLGGGAGRLWGTPTEPGLVQVTVTASDQINTPSPQSFSISVGTVDNTGSTLPPMTTRLVSVSPNPFNPATTIAFDVAGGETATVAVYDMRGRLVKHLGAYGPGSHRVYWNGTGITGSTMASGVYVMRMMSGGKAFVQKTLMLK
jgi:hypothetical protein